MKNICLTILLTVTSVSAFGQTKKDTVIKNFETFFATFKNSNPADKSKYSLKDYSDLWVRKSIPDELLMMIAYDDTKFYTSYLYHIKNSRDTLIRISHLNLKSDIKDLYTKFKQSVVSGEKTGKFNYKQDKEYSTKLKQIIDQTDPPPIGYYQTTTLLTKFPDRQVEESIIIITYSNELEVIDFGASQK